MVRKRPDIPPYIKNDSKNKDSERDTHAREHVVKVCLRSSLVMDDDHRDAFVAKVEELADAAARQRRRGSLLLLAHITRIMERQDRDIRPEWLVGRHDTWFARLMDIRAVKAKDGSVSATHPDPELAQTFLAYRHLFPEDEVVRCPHDNQVLLFAAQQFATTFHNSVWVPFEARLKRLCRSFVAVRVDDDADAGTWDLLKAIRWGGRWLAEIDGDEDAVQLALDARRVLLGSDDDSTKLTDEWVRKSCNWPALLRFNCWASQLLRMWGRAGIRLAPIFKAQRAHIQLDTRVVLNILGDMALVSKTAERDLELGARKELWASFFDLTKLAPSSKARALRTVIDTDGASVSFHLVEVVDGRKPMRKKAGPAATTCKPIGPEDIVLGADPGAVNVLCLATAMPIGGKTLSWTLTRGRYQQESGARAATEQRQRWRQDAGLHEADREMSDGSLCDGLDALVGYLEAWNRWRSRIWASELRRRVPRLKFRSHQGKQQVLTAFFNRVREDVQRAVRQEALHQVKRSERKKALRRAVSRPIRVAYGAAFKAFSTLCRGLCTPSTEAFRMCQAVLGKDNVTPAEECCTSKRCCGCHEVVHPLYSVTAEAEDRGCPAQTHPLDVTSDSEVSARGRLYIATTPRQRGLGYVVPRAAKEVRGLRFCPECRSYMDRDVMAAVNIGHSWRQELLTGERPPEFARAALAG